MQTLSANMEWFEFVCQTKCSLFFQFTVWNRKSVRFTAWGTFPLQLKSKGHHSTFKTIFVVTVYHHLLSMMLIIRAMWPWADFTADGLTSAFLRITSLWPFAAFCLVKLGNFCMQTKRMWVLVYMWENGHVVIETLNCNTTRVWWVMFENSEYTLLCKRH